MKSKKQNEKAITLITLVVAVSIMIIISSMLIYNAKTGIKMRNLKMMQNDIDLLDNKVDAYYVKYGALPIEIEYNVTPLSFENEKSPNDNDKYYILDLKAFEGLTLNYGTDFASVTAENVAEYTDIYVINEQSHHIYYVRGIEMDGTTYHTNDKDDNVNLFNIKKWKKIAGNTFEGYIGLDMSGDIYNLGTFNSLLNGEKIIDMALDQDHNICMLLDNGRAVYIDNHSKVTYFDEEYPELKSKKIIRFIPSFMYFFLLEDGKIYFPSSNNKLECFSDILSELLAPYYNGDLFKNNNIINFGTWGDNILLLLDNGKAYIAIEDGTDSIHFSCINDNYPELKNQQITDLSITAFGVSKLSVILGNGKAYYLDESNNLICINDQYEELKYEQIIQIASSLILLKNGTLYNIDSNNNLECINNTFKELKGNRITNVTIFAAVILDNGKTYAISGSEIHLLYGTDLLLGSKDIIDLSTTEEHIIAIDEEGKVYTWGDNYYGQLGDGTYNNSSIPICLSDITGNTLNDKKIVQISAGYEHSVAIDEAGKVYTWGNNTYGQLGNRTTTNSNVPICISDIFDNILNDKKIVQVSAAYRHTIAMDKEGKVYTWGYNEDGELGDGTTKVSNIPICISDISDNILNDKRIVQISAGYEHSVAIDEAGKVYTWGDNYYGRLGDGTTINSNVPICISDIFDNILNDKKIVQVSAAFGHTIAMDKEGKVYTWGDNTYGQLGNGTTTNSNVPICINDILGNKRISEIFADQNYTVLIDNKRIYYFLYGKTGTAR